MCSFDMRCSVSSKDTHVFCRYDFRMSVRSAFRSISRLITCWSSWSSASSTPPSSSTSGRGDGEELYRGGLVWRVARMSRRCEIDFQISKARSKLLATVNEMLCAIFRLEHRNTWQVRGPSVAAEGNSSPLASPSDESAHDGGGEGALQMKAKTLLWVASAEQ